MDYQTTWLGSVPCAAVQLHCTPTSSTHLFAMFTRPPEHSRLWSYEHLSNPTQDPSDVVNPEKVSGCKLMTVCMVSCSVHDSFFCVDGFTISSRVACEIMPRLARAVHESSHDACRLEIDWCLATCCGTLRGAASRPAPAQAEMSAMVVSAASASEHGSD